MAEEKKTTATSSNGEVPLATPGKSFVVNRKGQHVEVRFDKITDRIQDLCSAAYGRELSQIDPPLITQQVMLRFKNGMTTHEIDLVVVRICTDFGTHHRDYPELAARIKISDLQKRTRGSFLETVKALQTATDGENQLTSRIAPGLVKVSQDYFREIERRIDYRRDFRIGYFGIETLMRSYLMREGANIAERPQHMYMRVALGVHCCFAGPEQVSDSDMRERLEDAFTMYDSLSLQMISHASPTLFNAGTLHPQLSSCFQVTTDDDLVALLDTVKDAGMISKWAGGISIRVTEMRAAGSKIRSTGGESTGILHYVRLLNDLQVYVDQGGLRNGAFAMYIEPWHADIFTFLEIPRHQGPAAKLRTNSPDLKYALWVPDNFMVALRDGKDYYLMSPDRSPGLERCHGSEFAALYDRYVEEGRYVRKVPAREIFASWWKTVTEVGNPYWLFKDHINHKSNMQNVATIGSSNLCAEVTIPSWTGRPDDPDPARRLTEYGVCTLGALCLESYIVPDATAPRGSRLDWKRLISETKGLTKNLDRVLDVNFYPVEHCRRSSRRHRPLGIGTLGLANVFHQMKLVYGEPEARDLDEAIAACVYYGAMAASSQLAEELGPYETMDGSPAASGKLQPDLWVEQKHLDHDWETRVEKTTGGALTPGMWKRLRGRLRAGLLRNAYVTAYMPTASTSNIVGQNECFEPFTSNLYTRKTLAGEFIMMNKHLLEDLEVAGLWDDEMRRALIASGGSTQEIERIPEEMRRRYKTAREMDQRVLTLHAARRAPFICQSMSLNYYYTSPTVKDLATVLTLGWDKGLKTGSYYIHSRPAAGTQQTSIMVGKGSPPQEPAPSSQLSCSSGAGADSDGSGSTCIACAL